MLGGLVDDWEIQVGAEYLLNDQIMELSSFAKIRVHAGVFPMPTTVIIQDYSWEEYQVKKSASDRRWEDQRRTPQLT